MRTKKISKYETSMVTSIINRKISVTETVTAVKGYDPSFGFNHDKFVEWKKLYSLEQARAVFEKGEKFSLLFGDPENPDYYMDVFKGDYQTTRRIDVVFLENLKATRTYFVEFDPVQFGDPRNEMLLVQYWSDIYDDDGRRGTLFVADFVADGDLPSLQFGREVWHAVSVPWQDFYIGPPPSFDALIDGSFVARLPKITMPPADLLEPHRPSRDRKPSDPKRTPKGRFPW